MADESLGILVATPDDLNADGGMMTAITRVGNRKGRKDSAQHIDSAD